VPENREVNRKLPLNHIPALRVPRFVVHEPVSIHIFRNPKSHELAQRDHLELPKTIMVFPDLAPKLFGGMILGF
jgi:hypothetical protein